MKLPLPAEGSVPNRDRELVPHAQAWNTFPGLKSIDRAPHEEILHRAYSIWESEGHPNGRELAHWLEAEAEVMGRT